jgi:ankyrin repeat protein
VRLAPLLFALLGLNRAGRILYTTLFVLAVPAGLAWFVLLPRVQFNEEDERLFRAARHGDVAGIERSLAGGGHVNAAAPIDGKTALFRAAVFGHTDAVRALLRHGADPTRRGNDGRTALEIVLAERPKESDRPRAEALDAVAAALRAAKETP